MKLCSVNDCKKIHSAKGYCQTHYYRFRKHGSPNITMIDMSPPEKCTIDNCNKKYVAKGYCRKHYTQFRLYGNPLFSMRKRITNPPKICIQKGCNRKTVAKRFCDKHYRVECGKTKEYGIRKKKKVIGYYSNNKFKCEWCKVKDIRVLSIDHINGGGNQHRKEIGSFYSWLINNKFPKEFRVLCMNCNWVARTDKNNNGKWIKENQ